MYQKSWEESHEPDEKKLTYDEWLHKYKGDMDKVPDK